MSEFHHHPDGLVYLRGARTYQADLTDFRADLAIAGLPPYDGLPGECRERRYVPERLHAIYTADSQFGQPLPWPNGDAYLAATERLCAIRAAQESADELVGGA